MRLAVYVQTHALSIAHAGLASDGGAGAWCLAQRLAWSDPGLGRRTPEQIAGDLEQLLTRAGVTGPLVLVGNSVGGKHVRLYGDKHPEQVGGMVLIDARLETAAALGGHAPGRVAASQRMDGDPVWRAAQELQARLAQHGPSAPIEPRPPSH